MSNPIIIALCLVSALLIQELIAYFLFNILTKSIKTTDEEEEEIVPPPTELSDEVDAVETISPTTVTDLPLKRKWTPILKGSLERLCLFLSLYLNFPQMLIAFGAFKVGTRLSDDSHISNDYYLIGNLLSITLVFVTFLVARLSGWTLDFLAPNIN